MADSTVEDRELHALLSLLETESASGVSVLLEQMRSFSDGRLHRLARLVGAGSQASEYLDLVLAERAAPRIEGHLSRWETEGADLETGVLLLAEAGYPRLDTAAVPRKLDDLAQEIGADLPAGGGIEALRHVIHMVGEVHGFRGSASDYREPDSSYLNRVLERRSGLPITLSVLYILLGRRLGLPITGIALPAHFISSLALKEERIFFDPYEAGAILRVGDVMAIVNAAGQVFHPNHLRPAGSVAIVRRMLNNLLSVYQVREEMERADLIRRYLAAL